MHSSRKDTSALIAVNLERLKYVYADVSASAHGQNYLNSLGKLLHRFKQHPASSLIDFSIASFHFDQGNKPLALKVCQQAISRFPEAEGGEKCMKLKAHILRKTVSVTSEEYIIPQQPSKLKVAYINVDSLYFRAYRLTQKEIRFFRGIRKDTVRNVFIRNLPVVDK